jgi:hypothetical protein
MNPRASEIVVEIAKTFLSEVMQFPNWKRAFLRFEISDGDTATNGSYSTDSSVNLIGALQHSAMYEKVGALFEELHEVTSVSGKSFLVCLLSVDSNFDYKILFEHRDLDRWRITKLDGASGIPAGIDA